MRLISLAIMMLLIAFIPLMTANAIPNESPPGYSNCDLHSRNQNPELLYIPLAFEILDYRSYDQDSSTTSINLPSLPIRLDNSWSFTSLCSGFV